MKKLSMSLLVALAVIFAISSAFTASKRTYSFQHPSSGLYESVATNIQWTGGSTASYGLDAQTDFNLNTPGEACDDVDPEVVCAAYITVNAVDDEDISFLKFRAE